MKQTSALVLHFKILVGTRTRIWPQVGVVHHNFTRLISFAQFLNLGQTLFRIRTIIVIMMRFVIGTNLKQFGKTKGDEVPLTSDISHLIRTVLSFSILVIEFDKFNEFEIW